MKNYNYKKLAKYYDTTELGKEDDKKSEVIDKILVENKVKTVLDMTCGTGAQTIYLSKKGYEVVGSDLSKEMLKIAKKKSKGLNISYQQGDIRTSKFGKFDAVIAIYNAIGHLSKNDFEKALKNISQNLKENGLFIFDIFNLEFMKNGGFLNYKFIDTAVTNGETKFARFNNNKINYDKGILTVNQETYVQEGLSKPKVYNENWDMQIYSSSELKDLLNKNGFELIKVINMDGTKFDNKKSLSILTIARRKK